MFKNYFYQIFTASTLARQTGIFPNWTGSLKAAENYHCRSRVLDDYFIIYIKDGRGDLKSGNTDFKLQKGDCFFLFPGVLHSYYTSRKHLLELYWIGFNGFLSNSILQQLNIHPSNPVLRIRKQDEEKIVGMMETLIHAPENGEALGRSASLLEIFSRLITSKSPQAISIKKSIGEKKDKILQALAYIDGNYTSDISITELSGYVSMSRSAFSRLFKTETGNSPQAYLIEIRLEQSCHLLSGNMPIREVAHASGFNDEYYFSRCFKKRYGMSPNDLRKKLREISRVNTAESAKKTWL